MKSCNTGKDRNNLQEKTGSKDSVLSQQVTCRKDTKASRHCERNSMHDSAELGRWICSVCRKVQMALNQLSPRSALLVNSAAKPERNACN